jgi:hypothetical protein
MVLCALGIQLTALSLNLGVILLPRRGLPARAPAKERIQGWAFDAGR